MNKRRLTCQIPEKKHTSFPAQEGKTPNYVILYDRHVTRRPFNSLRGNSIYGETGVSERCGRNFTAVQGQVRGGRGAETDRRAMLQWRGRMDHRGECNRALVVSVAEFDPGVQLGRRPGAGKDAKRLHRTLSKLGFKVDIHTDLRSEEIYQLFQRESRRPVKDCFLAVLSSHGEEGCVFGADGEPVRLSRLFAFFDNGCMEEKAKLFLVQACRGHGLDDGVEVDSVEDAPESSFFSQHPAVPVDTAVMYATAPGYGAFMHPLGSVFLQTFCSLLEKEGNRNLELTRLMTRLSHSVAYTFQAKGQALGGKKEMPCLLTRLTREVFPFAEPGKDGGSAGLSATSLVGSKNTRTRTPSIS